MKLLAFYKKVFFLFMVKEDKTRTSISCDSNEVVFMLIQ